eukprot:4150020-Pleurochrysis_carterae.AAC.1
MHTHACVRPRWRACEPSLLSSIPLSCALPLARTRRASRYCPSTVLELSAAVARRGDLGRVARNVRTTQNKRIRLGR